MDAPARLRLRRDGVRVHGPAVRADARRDWPRGVRDVPRPDLGGPEGRGRRLPRPRGGGGPRARPRLRRGHGRAARPRDRRQHVHHRAHHGALLVLRRHRRRAARSGPRGNRAAAGARRPTGPALRVMPSRTVVARARKIRLLVMDVDGVLTDGRMILSERGDELKSFHTHDGIGLALAKRAGLRTALVTGESSPIAKTRGAKLGVDSVVIGARRKRESVEALRAEFDVTADAVAFIGDDLLDIPALQIAGLAVTVADASATVKAVAHVVTRARGGHGAVRELVELILRAQGSLRKIVDAYVREHGGR